MAEVNKSRVWTICVTHQKWIDRISEEYDTDVSAVVKRLVNVVNAETKQMKKKIFREIRCHRCFQGGPKGGYKAEVELTLPSMQLAWMEKVHQNCKHSSIDKTMRIILEFYSWLANDDDQLEKRLFKTLSVQDKQ